MQDALKTNRIETEKTINKVVEALISGSKLTKKINEGAARTSTENRKFKLANNTRADLSRIFHDYIFPLHENKPRKKEDLFLFQHPPRVVQLNTDIIPRMMDNFESLSDKSKLFFEPILDTTRTRENFLVDTAITDALHDYIEDRVDNLVTRFFQKNQRMPIQKEYDGLYRMAHNEIKYFIEVESFIYRNEPKRGQDVLSSLWILTHKNDQSVLQYAREISGTALKNPKATKSGDMYINCGTEYKQNKYGIYLEEEAVFGDDYFEQLETKIQQQILTANPPIGKIIRNKSQEFF